MHPAETVSHDEHRLDERPFDARRLHARRLYVRLHARGFGLRAARRQVAMAEAQVRRCLSAYDAARQPVASGLPAIPGAEDPVLAGRRLDDALARLAAVTDVLEQLHAG